MISNLAYGDEVSFEPNKLINIADGSKYYVKGIRVSGADALVNNGLQGGIQKAISLV